MTKKTIILLILPMFFAIGSCKHEPDILPVNYHLEATIEVSDIDYWPQSADVVLEIYIPGEGFSFKEIIVSKPVNDVINIKMPIQEIEFSVYDVKLSIRESTVKKIVLIDYGQVDINGSTVLPQKELQIVSFNRLKTSLFNSCTICHGESQNVAAGLYLLPDSIYSNLVDVQAKNSTLLRVKPYYSNNSFIMKVMNKEINFEHTASSNITNSQKELLKNWIEKGAFDENE